MNTKLKKVASTLFLKGTIFIIGAAVLAACIFVVFTLFQENIGMYVPVLIGLLISAVPFFIALFETLNLLSFIEENTAFSEASVNSLKKIRNCGIAISMIFVAELPFIFQAAQMDDAPGVVLIGLIIIFFSIVVAVFATVLERLLRNALDIKSENELTV